MENYEKLNCLKSLNSVCLIAHQNPDADAFASLVVLQEFLIKSFKINTVDILAECENIPTIFQPILEEKPFNQAKKTYEAAIMLDSPNSERLGIYKKFYEGAKLKVVIDHHATNNFSGDVNIVEICSSTCEIVYSILKYYNFKISKQNQGKLYAGIITDTNNFAVGAIGERTHRITSEIIDNVQHEEINKHFLTTTTHKQMQLFAQSINNIELFESGKILISHVTLEDIDNLNATKEDCSVIINRLASIVGTTLVCFIYPSRTNSFYVSMRAKVGYDVSKIAIKNQGGGHVGAAAFLSDKELSEIKKYITVELTEELKSKKEHKKQLF